MKRNRWMSFGWALVIHAALFTGAGNAFYKPAQFNVEIGAGVMEVSLVAGIDSEVRNESADGIHIQMPSPTPPLQPSRAKNSGGTGSGGAATETGTGHLRNPAPRYPAAARRQSQQGLVVLFAKVDVRGCVKTVFVKKSSGFYLLDHEALRTVRHWRFSPARLGTLTVESEVEIPIRFRLDERG